MEDQDKVGRSEEEDVEAHRQKQKLAAGEESRDETEGEDDVELHGRGGKTKT